MGMISNLQAIKFNTDKFDDSCWKIVSHVAKKPNIKNPILDALIEWFGDSNQYVDSTERGRMILNEFDYSTRQVKAIRRHIKRNDQIYNNKYARDYIFAFMKKYKEFFDEEFQGWYDSREASRMFMYY